MPDRALHIGIDGRELLGHATGVGRYLHEVLRIWAADSSWPHHVTLFVPQTPDSAIFAAPSISVVTLPAAHAGTWWEQTALPRSAAAANLDVFFGPGYTLPLRLRCPAVVAIYDVSFVAHPEWFSVREGWRRRWLTRSAARRARRIVTTSEFSAAEIERRLGVLRRKIAIAYPGAPASAPLDRLVRPPIVLYVGSLFTRRHIPELLHAFKQVVAVVPDARLIIVGENRTHPRIDPLAIARVLGLGDRVEWHAYATDDVLARLYRDARVFAFLSDYEGFAMTPLEAMANGAPPVLLDTPVAREVYGDAARLVRLDPTTLASALVTLLIDDDTHRRMVAAAAPALARFSWVRTAAIVRAVLEEAAAP